MDYVKRYEITADKLKQQYIEADLVRTPLDQFPGWLQRRSEALSVAANDYLAILRGDLTIPTVAAQEETTEHAYDAA